MNPYRQSNPIYGYGARPRGEAAQEVEAPAITQAVIAGKHIYNINAVYPPLERPPPRSDNVQQNSDAAFHLLIAKDFKEYFRSRNEHKDEFDEWFKKVCGSNEKANVRRSAAQSRFPKELQDDELANKITKRKNRIKPNCNKSGITQSDLRPNGDLDLSKIIEDDEQKDELNENIEDEDKDEENEEAESSSEEVDEEEEYIDDDGLGDYNVNYADDDYDPFSDSD